VSEQHLDAVGVALARSAPADDPGRRHLEGCAQCRILLRSYDQFLAGGQVDEEADSRLRAFVACAVGTHQRQGGGAGGPAAGPPRSGSRRSAGSPHRVSSRMLPLGFAAVLAAAAVVLFVRLRGAESPDILLRQSQSSTSSGSQLVALEPPSAAPSGVDLRWQPVAGADGYTVRIYGPDLRLLTDLSAHPGTTLRLDRSIAALTVVPESLFVRVVALRDSAAIGQSALRPLVLPR
jgi:hypothetical protein